MPTSQARFPLTRLLLALAFGSLLPAPGQAQSESSDATQSWQRQQPTVERTQRLMRGEGVAEPPQERREELRTLNEIARDLLPPDPVLPAPGLRDSTAGDRPATGQPTR